MTKENFMRLIGNIIWFIFGGLFSGLMWLLLGALLCVTIIGIPLGIQCFKVAKLSFAPFGKKVNVHPERHIISNVIWAVLFGWEIALYYLFSGIACCITIIGIPNGIVAFKMMKLAFLPFGAEIKK
jgi:uncharacterized membrane protein YccF (DUF307 family)